MNAPALHNRNGAISMRLLSALLTILTAGWIGIMGWLAVSVTELQQFAGRGDRFTLTDAIALERRIEARLDGGTNPEWLIERLDRINESLERLQLQVDRLEGRRGRHREE